MQKAFSNYAGWMVAGVLGVMMLSSGFQASQVKFGVVDVTKAVNDSKKGKAFVENLQAEFNKRRGLLDFVQTNKAIDSEKANRLRELSVKAGPTAAETAEIDAIKKEATDAEKKFDTLSRKQTLTEAERAELDDLGQRRRNADNILAGWQRDMTDEFSQLEASNRQALLEEARVSIQEVGKKQGYTMVFESNVAIYGANDITGEATKALDAAK